MDSSWIVNYTYNYSYLMIGESPQVKRDPVFAKRIALTAIMGSPGPAASPGRSPGRWAAAPVALPATPRTPSLVEESAAESPVRKAAMYWEWW